MCSNEPYSVYTSRVRKPKQSTGLKYVEIKIKHKTGNSSLIRSCKTREARKLTGFAVGESAALFRGIPPPRREGRDAYPENRISRDQSVLRHSEKESRGRFVPRYTLIFASSPQERHPRVEVVQRVQQYAREDNIKVSHIISIRAP